MKSENIPDQKESIEESHKKNAIIFVPGVAEGIEIVRDVAQEIKKELKARGEEPSDNRAALASRRLSFVSTHPELDGDHQQDISTHLSDMPEPAPIMSVVSSTKEHNTLQNRVDLVTDALREANTPGTEKITLVGHSAGGLAILTALTEEIHRRRELATKDENLPALHAVLIAPVLPGEILKMITMEKTFFSVVLRNFIKTVFTKHPTYALKLLSRKDMDPTTEDLQKLLGPMRSKKFEELVLKHRTPLSGGEGFDIFLFPEALKGIRKKGIFGGNWPKDITVEVIIPNNDQWISRKGQHTLADKTLKKRLGDQVTKTVVDGSHLPLGKDDAAAEIAKRILDGGK
ncbi:hypothetical protein COB18_00430 [Candidatus Kaiserbacteria bacterium]|nr:MAG: hypothetical protein COB18_00430 [Candidatus Kaiserbacteria bacterium]